MINEVITRACATKETIGTDNFKLCGLKRAAGDTKDLKGPYSSIYLQLNVDLAIGEVWTNQLYDSGHNNWVDYHDEHIISCGIITSPKTMKQIREQVYEAINTYCAMKTA